MEFSVYTLNAFTKGSKGGNPAGVVLDADKFTDNEMQKIANHIGFSETAFIHKSDVADFNIRYFTPNDEVNLCGHATIASFYLLLQNKVVNYGQYLIETKAGILEVNIEEDGRIFLSQALPYFGQEIRREKVLSSLNLELDGLNNELPIQIVSTGLKDILIPIKNKKILHQITPNFDEITSISKEYGVVGYHLFSLDSQDNSVVHCRNFAPLHNILEESATGTSNGALSCYLYKYGVIKGSQSLTFEQGFTMNCPSEIISKVKINEEREIIKIEVGGNCSGLKFHSMTL
ncbi:PhzF family phenazine biosynthesis protein [Bacillus spongiae]|uniref:PhzF family phenazine biosynthesis protein n=1 Tax=Bacillus spongiae TaxID=2683610 RepID=A0ABU8HCI4_9BACI